MFGFLIISIGTLLHEVAASIGKFEVRQKVESIYTMAFLNLFWQFFIYLGFAFFIRGQFLFSFESLPTFGVRAMLEILQAHMSTLALVTADRSTFGFIRTGTIPLLLLADILLGYTLQANQVVGIAIIFFVLFIVLMNHGIKKAGSMLVGISAVNAVFTISLFKYNITRYNSVEAEQVVMTAILLSYFALMARFRAKENPLVLFSKPILFLQSAANGIASILGGFAYAFAPASVILTLERSTSVIWATLAGNIYFHERKFLFKIFMALLLGFGFWFLAFKI